MQILSCQRSRTIILLAIFSALVFVTLLRLNHSTNYFQNNPNIEITPASHVQPEAQYQPQPQVELEPQSKQQTDTPEPENPQSESEAQAPPKSETTINHNTNIRPQNQNQNQKGSDPQPQPIPIPKPDPLSTLLNNYDCNIDLDLIRPLKSWDEDKVKYTRWDIAVTRSSKTTGTTKGSPPTIKEMPLPDPDTDPEPSLELDFSTIDQSLRYKALKSQKCKPIVIEAPPAETVDASHIYVGFATTIERLYEDLSAFAHWASNNGIHMFGLLQEDVVEQDLGDGNGTQLVVLDRTEEIREIESRAAELGINLKLNTSQAEYTDRYFALTKLMWENRDLEGTKTEWAVVIDDDTFFPSMGNIVRRLASAYDSSKKWYIGAPTESFEQLKGNMWMAFGGAGIFMSMPLLEEMIGSFDQCDEWKGPGDQKIAQCVYWHTKTKMTWDKGLFQLDLRNDVSGFFESGRPLPLSVHHWKSYFQFDMVAMSKVAAICGDNCLLNRWQIGDSKQWFFTNGFSLVKYSSPLSDEDMSSMEFTWDTDYWSPMDDYSYSLAPLRDMDWEKTSFQLQDAIVEQDGNRVRQVYVHQPDFFDEDGQVQIREVVWNLVDQ